MKVFRGHIVAIFAASCLVAPAMAADIGFGVQSGVDDHTVSFNYAVQDNAKTMREWTLGYREYRRKDVQGHSQEEGKGWGLGFSWRYYFPSHQNFFLGVRNDWWLMRVDWEAEMERQDEREHGETDIHILQPAMLLGWRSGNEKAQADFYFLTGYGFIVDTKGEEVSQFPSVSFGIAVRF